MSIDFFTFAAQILNLIILLFLLRKFLYLPVLKAVSERQAFIERELKKAALAREKAQKLEGECQQKMANLEIERQQILTQAREQAQKLEKELTDKAREDFEKSRERWQKKLESEQKSFETTTQNRVAENFGIFAATAVKQLADANLSELVINKFKNKMATLSKKKKEEFIAAYKQKSLLTVSSAQKLSPAERHSLESFLRERLDVDPKVKIKFLTDSKLLCGIKIQAEEQEISWNLETYLEMFKKNLDAQTTQ